MEEKLSDGLIALGSSKTSYSYDSPNPSILERFPSPFRSEDNEKQIKGSIEIVCPEFTSLCPKTGQPDFATIKILYQPDKWCVESKSIKLYLMGFRNHGEFHESCVKRICEDLINLLDPFFISVKGEFTPRGGIPFWPIAEWRK